MKKTLLFILTVMVMTVCYAQLPAKKLQLKGHPGLFHAQKSECMKNDKAEKVAERQANRAKGATKLAAKKVASPKAGDDGTIPVSEPITVTVNEFVPENYCSDGWYNYLMMVYGNSDNGDEYYIALDIYPETKSWKGTFNIDDWTLGGYYCSAVNNLTTGNSAWVVDEEPSTVTIQPSGTPEHYTVSGTLYGDDGNTYILEGTEVYYPDPVTYNMKGIKWQTVNYGGGDFVGAMTTIENAYFQVNFILDEDQDEPVDGKEYTMSDMDSYFTIGYWNGKTIYIEDLSFVSTTDPESGDQHIVLSIVDDKGDTYNIDYVTPHAPETYNDVYLTANAATLYDYTSDGVWQFLGVSEDGMWNLSIAGFSNTLVGDYTQSDIFEDYTYIGLSDLTVDITLDYVKIDNIKVVAGPNADEYICTADFYCYNGNCYHVTINHVHPAIIDRINMVAHNLKLRYDSDYMEYYLSATDADYLFEAAMPAPITQFAKDELTMIIAKKGEDSGIALYEVYPFTIAYDENNQATQLNGGCLAMDGTEFTFTFDYIKPEPTRTENLTGSLVEGELRPQDGYFTISGYNEDQTTELMLTVPSDNIDGTYKLWDFDAYKSYVAENASSWTPNPLMIDDADITISTAMENGREMATVKGSMLLVSGDDDTDVALYNIDIKVPVKRGLVQDEEEMDFEATYTLDQISITDKAVEEGWILVQGKNSANQSFAMVFFANEPDAEITVPAGEYVINDTQEEGTVVASSGLDVSGYQATASFAANTNVLGFLVGNPWFMVGGKASVANVDGKLSIKVEALNSYNRNILIGVNADLPTSINAANAANAVNGKHLVNGRIVINRNGERYNVSGLRIK
ncbi:MAG: hypothetical protein KBS99_07430 [Prevotellaceae bacterium]|nr:hypothetical protein [Candidatus Colivivens caballi]